MVGLKRDYPIKGFTTHVCICSKYFGPFGFYFLKLFLRIVFENTDNTIFVFFKNYFYSFNFVFYELLGIKHVLFFIT